eukprot:SAG11_NODE_2131_length_3777_cov_1.575041_3_plen_233_part_00
MAKKRPVKQRQTSRDDVAPLVVQQEQEQVEQQEQQEQQVRRQPKQQLASQLRRVTIAMPPGVRAGEKIKVSSGGADFIIQAPKGVAPGQQFVAELRQQHDAKLADATTAVIFGFQVRLQLHGMSSWIAQAVAVASGALQELFGDTNMWQHAIVAVLATYSENAFNPTNAYVVQTRTHTNARHYMRLYFTVMLSAAAPGVYWAGLPLDVLGVVALAMMVPSAWRANSALPCVS